MSYFTRSRVEDDDGYALANGSPYLTIAPREDEFVGSVSVPEHEAIDTGLLDANGDVIMRAPNPVGFGRDDEW